MYFIPDSIENTLLGLVYSFHHLGHFDLLCRYLLPVRSLGIVSSEHVWESEWEREREREERVRERRRNREEREREKERGNE